MWTVQMLQKQQLYLAACDSIQNNSAAKLILYSMAYARQNNRQASLTGNNLQRILYHTARAGSSGTGNIRPVHL